MKALLYLTFLSGLFCFMISACETNNLHNFEDGYISGTFSCNKLINGAPNDSVRGFCILLKNRENSVTTYYPMDLYTFSTPEIPFSFPPEIINVRYDGTDCGPMFFPDSLIYKYKVKLKYRNTNDNEKVDFLCGPCASMEVGFPWKNFKQIIVEDIKIDPL